MKEVDLLSSESDYSNLSFSQASCLISAKELSEKTDELYSITWNGINRSISDTFITAKELSDKANELYSITWNGINRP